MSGDLPPPWVPDRVAPLVAALDRGFRLTVANEPLQRVLGRALPASDVTLLDLIVPDDIGLVLTAVHRLDTPTPTTSLDARLRHISGCVVHTRWSIHANGPDAAIEMWGRDVTPEYPLRERFAESN